MTVVFVDYTACQCHWSDDQLLHSCRLTTYVLEMSIWEWEFPWESDSRLKRMGMGIAFALLMRMKMRMEVMTWEWEWHVVCVGVNIPVRIHTKCDTYMLLHSNIQ